MTRHIQGYVGWEIETPDGEIRDSSEGRPQLITDWGLNALHNNNIASISDYCRVGTGTVEPSPEQNDLVNRHGGVSGAAKDPVTSNSGGASWWHELRRTYEFAADTIDGAALTEIGFFEDNSIGGMFSRTLIKNSEGDPTTLPIQPGEILRVFYAIRVHVPNDDVSGTFQIDGETYNYTSRACVAADKEGYLNFPQGSLTDVHFFETDVLGAIESAPMGASSEADSPVMSTYVEGSFETVWSLTGGLVVGNFPTGIGSMRLDSGWVSSFCQISFSPKLPKDATKTLNFQDFLTLSWARGEPT